MESWHASPVPLFQYIARSAMMGCDPCTFVDMSLPGTWALASIVFRELPGIEKAGMVFAPCCVMYVMVTVAAVGFGFCTRTYVVKPHWVVPSAR